MEIAALDLLANDCRRQILRLVWEREVGAGEIAQQFRVTFGAVSQHLALLLNAGVVERRREGRRLFYRARREALGPLASGLEALWAAQLLELKRLAEAEQQRVDLIEK